MGMTTQTVERPGGGGTGGLRGSGGAARPANLPRIALTALAPAVWGTTYIVTTELLPDGHPLFAGLLRALPAGLIALAFTRTLPRGTWWWKAAALGVLNIGLFLPLLFTAAERLPGGVAATLGAAQPLAVAFLAVGVLGERLSAWRLLGGVVGVAGVGLVVIGPDAALDGVGIAAGLAGAATMALGVTLTRRWGRPAGVSPTAFAGWQLTAGGLFLLPVTFLAEGAPPEIGGKAALGYLWLGLVGGLITYALWFQGITTLPVTSAALLGLLSPLVAAVLGAAVLDQTLGPVQLLGFALSLAALVAGQLPPPGSVRKPADPEPVDLKPGAAKPSAAEPSAVAPNTPKGTPR
ncbi:Protein PecM [Actinacidiphila bryophytorum]|uniref:Protein PecM n=2 Tax=Actinacidiphila bryophytorum TaxID=1436133 RepID=A0A9W4E4F2_9ACTN|nr:Protein PecM [Actinacidiphila bryophytorum]